MTEPWDAGPWLPWPETPAPEGVRCLVKTPHDRVYQGIWYPMSGWVNDEDDPFDDVVQYAVLK